MLCVHPPAEGEGCVSFYHIISVVCGHLFYNYSRHSCSTISEDEAVW